MSFSFVFAFFHHLPGRRPMHKFLPVSCFNTSWFTRGTSIIRIRIEICTNKKIDHKSFCFVIIKRLLASRSNYFNRKLVEKSHLFIFGELLQNGRPPTTNELDKIQIRPYRLKWTTGATDKKLDRAKKR